MGWQSRLSKENKPQFERTCNKCGNTGVKRTYVATDGVFLEKPVEVKCVHVLRKEAEDKRRADLDEADRKLVAGMLKEEAAENAAIVIAK